MRCRHRRHALGELGRGGVEVLLVDQLRRPVVRAAHVLADLGDGEERVDRGQAGAERRSPPAAGRAAGCGAARGGRPCSRSRPWRCRPSGTNCSPSSAAALAQAAGELVDRGAPRVGGQSLPAGAVDAEELVHDRPADDVLEGLSHGARGLAPRRAPQRRCRRRKGFPNARRLTYYAAARPDARADRSDPRDQRFLPSPVRRRVRAESAGGLAPVAADLHLRHGARHRPAERRCMQLRAVRASWRARLFIVFGVAGLRRR